MPLSVKQMSMRHGVWSLCLLLQFFSSSCRSARPMQVIKSWSTIVTEKSSTKIACKGSQEVKWCSWKLGSLEVSSEQNLTSSDPEMVDIGTGKDVDMCFLTIPTVAADKHRGKWICELVGECPQEEYEDDIETNSVPIGDATDYGRLLTPATQQSRSLCREDCGCWNKDSQEVEIDVVSPGEYGILPAREAYFALLDGTASITVRANEPFDKCTISKEGQKIVEILATDKRERCANLPGRNQGRVCGNLAAGLPSCLLSINRMTSGMAATWQFEITWNNRSVVKSAEVPVSVVELPLDVAVVVGEKELTVRDAEAGIELIEGKETVKCIITVVNDRDPVTPEAVLFLGSRRIPETRACRPPRRHSFCSEFHLDVHERHQGLELTCGGRLPPVDKDSRTVDKTAYVYNGLSLSLLVSVSFAPKLVVPSSSSSGDQQTDVHVVCDRSACVGQSYTINVVFDSKPEPVGAQWVIRDNDVRRRETVTEAIRGTAYVAEKIQSAKDLVFPYRYEARLQFERLTREDVDPMTEHALEVRNEVGDSKFTIRFRADGECRCKSSLAGQSTAVTSGLARPQDLGDVKPFLDSCITLGSSLLGNFNVGGSRRTSQQSEKAFQAEVEEFFKQASCSGQGEEIFNSYQNHRRPEPLTAQPTHILFTRLNPVHKHRGHQASALSNQQALLAAAQTVVANSNLLPVSEPTAVADSDIFPASEPTAMGTHDLTSGSTATALRNSDAAVASEASAVAGSDVDPASEATAVAGSDVDPDSKATAVAGSDVDPASEATASAGSDVAPANEATAVGSSDTTSADGALSPGEVAENAPMEAAAIGAQEAGAQLGPTGELMLDGEPFLGQPPEAAVPEDPGLEVNTESTSVLFE